MQPVSTLVVAALEEIEAIAGRDPGDGLSGVPTGFGDLDALTNGLHPGQLLIVAGRRARGNLFWASTSPGRRRSATGCPPSCSPSR